eukprot:5601858-Pyramimonas_sp.AAC.1
MKGVSHRRDEAGFSSVAGKPRDKQQATTFAEKRHSSPPSLGRPLKALGDPEAGHPTSTAAARRL